VAALPLRADFVAKVAAQVTILFDAFEKTSDLKRGWGYSASIEHAGRRILFDTGSKGSDFAYNANAIGVDLKRLDFVVLSHRHNDHTAGLNHVLHENPGVTIYTPLEVAGFNFPCRRAHGSTPPCLHPEARPTRRLQCEHRAVADRSCESGCQKPTRVSARAQPQTRPSERLR